MRSAHTLRRAIEIIEDDLENKTYKPTLADLVRLLQIEKAIGADAPLEVRVRWVESEMKMEPSINR